PEAKARTARQVGVGERAAAHGAGSHAVRRGGAERSRVRDAHRRSQPARHSARLPEELSNSRPSAWRPCAVEGPPRKTQGTLAVHAFTCSRTSMLLRVALEYGQTTCALSTRAFNCAWSMPGALIVRS